MSLIEQLTFRLETPDDHRQVEELTRRAFGHDCDEHFIVHLLRESPSYIPELCFIACDGNEILGHILYTRAYIHSPGGQKHEVISFGPISVLPEYQSKGIGTALIELTIAIAKNKGDHDAVFIYGDPEYYHRFGFTNAVRYDVTTPKGENFEEFMGMELYPGGLLGIKGKLHQDAAFTVDKAALREFDKMFAL